MAIESQSDSARQGYLAKKTAAEIKRKTEMKKKAQLEKQKRLIESEKQQKKTDRESNVNAKRTLLLEKQAKKVYLKPEFLIS